MRRTSIGLLVLLASPVCVGSALAWPTDPTQNVAIARGPGEQAVFAMATDAPAGEPAERYLARHEGELVARVAYWSGAGPGVVRSLLRALSERATTLGLRVAGLEAATLIELTAFGTAVMMHWRYTHAFRAARAEVIS